MGGRSLESQMNLFDMVLLDLSRRQIICDFSIGAFSNGANDLQTLIFNNLAHHDALKIFDEHSSFLREFNPSLGFSLKIDLGNRVFSIPFIFFQIKENAGKAYLAITLSSHQGVANWLGGLGFVSYVDKQLSVKSELMDDVTRVAGVFADVLYGLAGIVPYIIAKDTGDRFMGLI